jgi:soluble lytic murein transglycosylase-like protein
MTPAEATVCQRVLRYAPTVDRRVGGYGLDRWLLLGLIAQESAGKSGAVRVEREFWARYQAGILADLAKAGLSKWAKYPDLVSASYGLTQMMFPVALERGMVLEYPTDLCDPETGIEAGCRQLARCLAQAAAAVDPVKASLLRYNGGGNLNYPAHVLGWVALLHEVAGA